MLQKNTCKIHALNFKEYCGHQADQGNISLSREFRPCSIPELSAAVTSLFASVHPIQNRSLRKNPSEPSVGEAMKTHVFWIIAVTMTISGGTVHAVFVHIMPYLINMDFCGLALQVSGFSG